MRIDQVFVAVVSVFEAVATSSFAPEFNVEESTERKAVVPPETGEPLSVQLILHATSFGTAKKDALDDGLAAIRLVVPAGTCVTNVHVLSALELHEQEPVS